MKKKIVILGGQGNGTVIASVIEDIMKNDGEWELVGYLNDDLKKGELINGYPVLGPITKEKCDELKDYYFIYALVSVSRAKERVEKLESLEIAIEKFATIIHPTATVGSCVDIGFGVVLMPNVVISPNVKIDNHSQVYASALIGHDTTLEKYCFVANHASIGSNVFIKEGAHIGSNSCILEKLTIGSWALVGLGSVVIKDVDKHDKVVGNPARSIK